METIYLNLDARRVTVCEGAQDQKACVGQETVCYTVLPRHKPARPEGKVLDFDACRRALEGEPVAEEAPEEIPAPEAPARPRRKLDLALAADLIASAGMLAAVGTVAVRFFLGS